MYSVFHERSKITAPFTEHLTFKEKNEFYAFTLDES